jgi:TM2 domain-containing membrane protein YozV/TolB-like protein
MEDKTMRLISFVTCFIAVTAPCVFGQQEEQKSLVAMKINAMSVQLFSTMPQTEQPVTIAVVDFASSTGKAKVQQLGRAVAMLVQETVSKDSRFVLIEREKLDAVMKEIALGQSGIIDEDQAQKAGTMLGASLIVTGSVAEIGEFFLVSCRVINIGTGQITSSAAAEIRQDNLLAVSSKYVVVKKYAAVPAFQSLIIPGWGQFYNDQPNKGLVYLVLGGLSIGTAGVSYLLYQNVGYEDAATREEAQQAYDKWVWTYRAHIGSLGAAAVVWGIAVIDAYVVAKMNLKKPKAAAPETGATSLKPYLQVDEDGVAAGVALRF